MYDRRTLLHFNFQLREIGSLTIYKGFLGCAKLAEEQRNTIVPTPSNALGWLPNSQILIFFLLVRTFLLVLTTTGGLRNGFKLVRTP